MVRLLQLIGLLSATVFDPTETLAIVSQHTTLADGCSLRDGTVISKWTKADQHDDTGLNLCVDDKFMTQFYVLGAPKAGTTSVSMDTACGGMQLAGGMKEMNFWRRSYLVEYRYNQTQMRARWLEMMPTCPTDQRRVMTENSPAYLSQVPKPGDPPSTMSLPPVMRSVYGDAASKRLVFAVMIREPLSRVHSHWHYSGPTRLSNYTGSFQKEVEAYLADPSDFRMETRVWYSQYGAQLDQWLGSFGPEQFLVIPYKAYASNGTVVCEELAKRLQFKIGCSAETAHGKEVHHAALEEETTLELRQRFQNFMADDKLLLVNLLAKGQPLGMGLPKYWGPRGSPQHIDEWLARWW